MLIKVSFLSLRTNSETRGHPLKLVVQPVSRDCRKYFFSNRIVNIWNALPSDVVLAVSIEAFKRRLGRLDLTGYVRWA